MRLELILVFLSLPFLAGRELAAQGSKKDLQKLAESYCDLSGLKMSNDGRWLTIGKSYNQQNDTILIFSSLCTEQPVCYRANVGSIDFLSNDRLLVKSRQQVELLNLKEQKSLFFNKVKQIRVLKDNTMFLLHYDKEEHNKLELRDSCGDILNTLNNVYWYYASGKDNVYAITEDEDSTYRIIALRGRSSETVYSSSQRIAYLISNPGEKGLMIYEQCQDSTSQEVLFLDLNSRKVYPLKEVLSESVQHGSSEVIHEGEVYYLNLEINDPKIDASLVDIWYGNDYKLDKKFSPPIRVLNYVWEPKKKIIRQIGNDNLTTNLNIGSDRHFLSFDEYYLQTYNSVYPQIQIYVYDIIRDRYSVLAITREMFLSGNGEYALYESKGEWNLCHIPSGSRKVINIEGLKKPWFTDDGKAVLFEGEGALWKFDLKSGMLAETVAFNGYQTTIVNGEWEKISTREGNFSQQWINLLEPLVIRLYDPEENKTSYVLLHKGKSKVIVPQTTCNIKFLKYDKNYNWFAWVEEDYNMPPRMAYCKAGEAGKILYQSNKADKAILSLKQEIVSYTDSDGHPLKGILFYPLQYVPSEKYPMVMLIYEKQRHLSNRYSLPSFREDIGFNIRLFLEKGYFVYMPDILIQGKDGPGKDALDCVTRSLDALSDNPSINKKKIGLIGYSFGGYETDFIATHSDRFAAYVSGAGHSDIIWAYHAFNYNFLFPDYVRIEALQYKLGVLFSVNKFLYFENNPLYYAENVNAPVLVWSGLEDENVTSDHSMAFYNALKRNKKTVIALFYKGEAHGLSNPQAQYDITSKTLDWFDYFLKNETDAKWISTGLE